MTMKNALAVRELMAAGQMPDESEARVHPQVDEYVAKRALTNNGFKPTGSKIDGHKTTTSYEHPDGHKAKLTTTSMPFGGPSESSLHVTATPGMHNALEATER